MTSFFDDVVSKLAVACHSNYRSELNFLNEFCTATKATKKGEIVTADALIDDGLNAIKSKDITESDFALSMVTFLQRYFNWRGEQVKGSTQRNLLRMVKSYLQYKGVRMLPADYARVRLNAIIDDGKHNFDAAELEKLLRVVDGNYFAYYTALLSSGMRGEECLSITRGDMRLTTVDGVERFFINLKGVTTKKRRAREVIISAEATTAIMPRYDECDKGEFVYMPNLTSKVPTYRRTFAGIGFQRHLKTAGLGNLTPKPTPHRLRSYFKGVGDKHGLTEWSHRMMGHSKSDGVEFLPTYGGLKKDTDKLAFYVKVEADLTIMDAAKVRAELQQKDMVHNIEIEQLRQEIQTIRSEKRHEQK